MSDYTSTFGTISGGGQTITLTPVMGTDRPKTPAGLIVTRAVETKAGWLGQILVDKEIVYQSGGPSASSDIALDDANERVVKAIRGLFTDALADRV